MAIQRILRYLYELKQVFIGMRNALLLLDHPFILQSF